MCKGLTFHSTLFRSFGDDFYWPCCVQYATMTGLFIADFSHRLYLVQACQVPLTQTFIFWTPIHDLQTISRALWSYPENWKKLSYPLPSYECTNEQTYALVAHRLEHTTAILLGVWVSDEA